MAANGDGSIAERTMRMTVYSRTRVKSSARIGDNYCFSNSPLPMRFKTVNPAFLASEIESGFSLVGELNDEMILRTGLRQSGHFSKGGRLTGRFNVNFPPQTLQSPSINSYS